MFRSRDYNRWLASVNRSLSSKVDEWRRGVQQWWLPTHCVLCGAAGDARDLCAACRADLPRAAHSCQRCALPLPVDGTCGRCQRHPFPFTHAVAGFLYKPPFDSLIVQLKFGRRLALSRLLGELLVETWQTALSAGISVDRIVPVPLHPARLRERGYNQALELARPLARTWGVPLDAYCAERVRATVPQSDLPAKRRRSNIKGAFRVTKALTGQHVAVVDDVMTSGHTVSEFAATLHRAGAASVSVWVGARAVL